MTIQPFEINIEPPVIDDLRDRLGGTAGPTRSMAPAGTTA